MKTLMKLGQKLYIYIYIYIYKAVKSDPLQSAQILEEQDKQVAGSNPTWVNFLYGIKKP